jgi:hypothetical protein
MARSDHEAMSSVEERIVALMGEFPNIDDESIAQLVRDELFNARILDKVYLAWATSETVGRVRRTLVVSAIRQERTREEKAMRDQQAAELRRIAETTPVRCQSCGKDSAPRATRCRWCLEPIG